MKQIDLKRLDLNLLVVFAILMRERSATRAGTALSISQSAVSHSLGRLRQMFADALFVRRGNALVPTPRAERILQQIQPALDGIERTINSSTNFNPATSRQVFRIGVPGAVDVCVTPLLLGKLARQAPTVDLVVRQADVTSGQSLIEADRIDLAVSVFFDVRSGIEKQEIGSSDYACIFDGKRLGLRPPIRLNDYLAAGHVLTSFSGDRSGVVDARLKELGHRRRVVVATLEFSSVPFYLANSELVATLPAYAARVYARRLRLALSPLPFTLEPLTLSMVWSKRFNDDPAQLWFRALVADCVRSIVNTATRR